MSTPQLFVPGVVSTAAPEFGLTFEPDGRTAYFNRASEDRKLLTIWVARWTAAGWTAEVAAFSGSDRDLDPFVTPDGERLYFSSERPRPGHAEPTPPADPEPHLWYLERTGTTWSAPILVEGPVGELPTNFMSLTRDGTLYVGSFRDGVNSIYRAAPRGAGFGPPELLEFDAEAPARRGNPLIAPDGSFLLLAAQAPGGRTDGDLYVARPLATGWTKPWSLGSVVNSAQTELAPGLSPDGRYLFFTSERPGVLPAPAAGRPPGDLYQIDLAALPIAEPVAP
jgi:Tol biopolymer transport system component